MNGIVLAVVIVVVLAGIVIAIFGWDRYRAGGRSPDGVGGGARPTAEVFLDPDTGLRMRVWYDERTGRRDYRPE